MKKIICKIFQIDKTKCAPENRKFIKRYLHNPILLLIAFCAVGNLAVIWYSGMIIPLKHTPDHYSVLINNFMFYGVSSFVSVTMPFIPIILLLTAVFIFFRSFSRKPTASINGIRLLWSFSLVDFIATAVGLVMVMCFGMNYFSKVLQPNFNESAENYTYFPNIYQFAMVGILVLGLIWLLSVFSRMRFLNSIKNSLYYGTFIRKGSLCYGILNILFAIAHVTMIFVIYKWASAILTNFEITPENMNIINASLYFCVVQRLLESVMAFIYFFYIGSKAKKQKKELALLNGAVPEVVDETNLMNAPEKVLAESSSQEVTENTA